MKKFVIYRITFPTGQFYIGRTYHSIDLRLNRHLTSLKKGSHGNIAMQEIYNEYGSKEFNIEVLLEDESDDRCYVNLLENYLICDHPNTINYYKGRKSDKQLGSYLKEVRKKYNSRHSYGGKKLNQKALLT